MMSKLTYMSCYGDITQPQDREQRLCLGLEVIGMSFQLFS